MGRIKALDGLRGLAAFTVVIAHFFGEVTHGVRALSIGWFGVETFFVLSGFLIGSIILNERDKPGFVLGFYARRAARILPVYWIMATVVVSLVAILAAYAWVEPTFSLTTYLTFTPNIATTITGYEDSVWMRPTWTLAVEEQFYLVLPLLILATPRKALLPALLGLWAASGVFRAVVDPVSHLGALVLLPGRMDMLIAGVGAAWALKHLDLSRRLTVLRLIPILTIPAGAALYLLGKDAFVLYSQCFFSVGLAAFILSLALGAPDGRKLLESGVLTFFGRISYALYLIHQPINGLLHGLILGAEPDVATPAQIGVTLLAVAASIMLADLSWRFLEAPILGYARRKLSTPAAVPALAR